MKKFLYILIGIFVPSLVVSQTTANNYILSTSYQVKTTDGTHKVGTSIDLIDDEKIQSITYFDGLGRPMQSIVKQGGGNKEDIITPIIYDKLGRQTRDYLSYPRSISSLFLDDDLFPDPDVNANNYQIILENDFTSSLGSWYEGDAYYDIDDGRLIAYVDGSFEGVENELNGGFTTVAGEMITVKINFDKGNTLSNVRLYMVETDSNGNFIQNVMLNDNLQTGYGKYTYTPTTSGNVISYLHVNKDDTYTNTETYFYIDDIIMFTGSDFDRYILKINDFYKTKYPDDFTELSIEEINPFSEKKIETSPLNRVRQLGAPGSSWKINKNSSSDHTIKFEYNTNVTSDNVRLFEVLFVGNDRGTPQLLSDYYAENQLYKNITKDENWQPNQINPNDHTTEEFKDKQGRVILKRDYDEENIHDTYYVYDDYGNLTYVIPPKVEASTATLATINSKLDNLCYQYKYDHRNRLVEKRIPGKGWEYIVYDKLDRPVLTQDANLKINNEWLFTKYDVFGRVVYTGIYTHANLQDQGDMQNILNTYYLNTSANLYESKLTTEGSYNYYSNQSYPNNNLEILTVNYYDNYDFNIPLSITIPSEVWESNDITSNTKSLATGSKIKVLTTGNWISSVIAYDKKARPIWTGSYNEYLNTTDIVKNKLDFVGKTLSSVNIHRKAGKEDIVIEDTFKYDHAGRLLAQTQGIRDAEFDATVDLTLDDSTPNNQTSYIASNSITLTPNFIALPGFSAKINAITQEKELIVLNKYNELGQLKYKKVGGDVAATITNSIGLQTVDYSYNVRGWLKQINNPNTLGNDLFSFKINYNTVGHGATPLYNGNISETEWRTANTDNSLHWYKYDYDALNRLTNAVDNLGKLTETLEYDKNGNITNLVRLGNIVGGSTSPDINNPLHFGTMDNLTYTYESNSNQLKQVLDAGNNTYGFKDSSVDDQDYWYDVNGNMIKDDNKDITSITYNHLNLPNRILFSGTNRFIDYIYDAAGTKLKKKVTDGSAVKETYYAGNYIYEDSSLKFFNHPEGYVEPVNPNSYGDGFNYVYQFKDHLGNIRLSYQDVNQNNASTVSLEILEENNYYPFGLKHKGYNDNLGAFVNLALKMKYNGVEYEDALGLNLYEMDFRQYDPTIARFTSNDPVTHFNQSTYIAFDNNPLFWADPSGADSINGETVGADGLTNSQWMELSRPGGGGFNAMSTQARENVAYLNNKKKQSKLEVGETQEVTRLEKFKLIMGAYNAAMMLYSYKEAIDRYAKQTGHFEVYRDKLIYSVLNLSLDILNFYVGHEEKAYLHSYVSFDENYNVIALGYNEADNVGFVNYAQDSPRINYVYTGMAISGDVESVHNTQMWGLNQSTIIPGGYGVSFNSNGNPGYGINFVKFKTLELKKEYLSYWIRYENDIIKRLIKDSK